MKSYFFSIISLELITFAASDSFIESLVNKQASNDSISRRINDGFIVTDTSRFIRRTNHKLPHQEAESILETAIVSASNKQDRRPSFLQISQFDDQFRGRPLNGSNVYQHRHEYYDDSENNLFSNLKPFLSSQYQQDSLDRQVETKQVQPNELNSSFLELFDDLWEIKNKSRITLVRLEYFRNNSKFYNFDKGIIQSNRSNTNTNHSKIQTHFEPTIKQVRPPSQPPVHLKKIVGFPFINRQYGGEKNHNIKETIGKPAANNSTKLINNNGKQIDRVSNQLNILPGTVRNNPQKVLASLGCQIHDWFLLVQSKANRIISSLTIPFANKQVILPMGISASSRQDTTNVRSIDDVIIEIDQEISNSSTPNNNRNSSPIKHSPVKRQALNMDPNSGDSKQCIELDLNLRARCNTTSAIVNVNLNSTFPGTDKSIEDNCEQLAFLLGSCWPQQLERITSSLASWNESIVSSPDFPLPTPMTSKSDDNNTGEHQSGSGKAVSCGVAPQVQEIVLDRISWMWLNLCMDRKFRQDYIDNLKCLSLWTQDRAQLVCSNEYKRMQANLAVSSEIVAKTTLQSNELNMLRSANDLAQSTGSGNSRGDRSGVFEGIDRELESKTLCCMFDLFLRCVHKQAVKDCSNSGSQFVISFMSRIGTDDMKYLCNGEPRSIIRTNPKHPENSLRKGDNSTSHEKGPFIESNYCNEPRIDAALHGVTNQLYEDKIPSSGKPRPLGSKSRPANINYNPTSMSDGQTLVPETNSGRPKVDLDVISALISWIFTISIHFLLLAIIFSR